ncbi:FAD-dependent oxidoreductase [Mycobacterium marinum]|uniref:FAD-dependent oxidoreductase n=1 Tax=Mycobacterium marinum TaxID=1781 RepID=UPI000B969BA5|nr:oxidoreductase [Mycobacterium marinum]MDC8981442.1 oxidoreductase [Mycobacterium marinum]MDC8996083.1 oxidoreductase [Mycobacterium marinum]MDC9001751.1 oxidoreductase [Mycobacterium marinum]MDC9012296.1 oxidoreductase [Mycobacterium marinum]MDC9014111.1 oxidoreductase [Mycobacterium marinum]
MGASVEKRAVNPAEHATVIGASIGGLCAARVLSDFYSKVIVCERDDLPSTPSGRGTVPQDQHLHLLMARGAAELDTLFPGLLTDLVAAGVPMLDNRPDCIYLGAAGHVLGTGAKLRKQYTAYLPSRPHLEWQLRRRVLALGNVEIRQRKVREPHFDPVRQRVTGLLLDDHDGDPELIASGLVIDAAGRGTRLPVWLTQWGYQRPPEETVDIGINYASQRLRIPDGLMREKIVVTGVGPGQSLGLGMLCNEDGSWILTTFGVAKAKPPSTFGEMRELAYRLLPSRFVAALAAAGPIGEPVFHAFPASRWRRYDKLSRFPAGIVALGDAVASFNPTFGQGMTMASLQAGHLRRALQSHPAEPANGFNRATAKTIRPVWTMNALTDLCFQHAEGRMPRWYRPVGGLYDQFLGAAETDPVLAEWFLRRISLLDSLYMVPSPLIIGRAVAHNARMWLRQRRPKPSATSR